MEEKKLTLKSLFEDSESSCEQIQKNENYTLKNLFKETDTYKTNNKIKINGAKESRLKKLLEKNANRRLCPEETIEAKKLIDNPEYSKGFCNRCGDKCNSENRTPVYSLGICQKYLRLALINKQNPYDASSIESMIQKITSKGKDL